jgi:hypothetical protein
VRSLILALARFEIASKDQTRALEREWGAYRKQHQLDVEGKTTARMSGKLSLSKIAGKNPPRVAPPKQSPEQ